MKDAIATRNRRRGIRPRIIACRWLSYAVFLPWCGFTIFIFAWLLYNSLKSNHELFANVWSLPKVLHWENYSKAWNVAHIGIYFSNSIFIVLVSVVVTIILGSMVGYALARISFKGNTTITYSLIAGMGVPVQLLLVPLFMLLNHMHLVDNHFGLILAYVAYLLPFTSFLLIGFFRTLPSELEEAATLEGYSDFSIFWRIMLPLSSPGLITAAIFNFIVLWNEYLLALVLLSSPKRWTVSLGLYNLRVAMGSIADWTTLFAGTVIIMIPAVLVYLFLSERMITGLTLGATKE